jgi:hypothetical protein
VRRHAGSNGDEAEVAIAPGDVPQALGSVGQAVQEYRRAFGRAVGLENV